MTLTPDASRPEDNDRLRKDDGASSQDPATPSPYGYDNAGYGAPQTPSAPPASPYAAPQGQYPSYAPASNTPDTQGNQGMYANPGGHIPQEDMWTNAQKPQNMATILGSTSIGLILLSFLVGPFALLSPVAAIFGIIQANKATRMGINATLGKVLSWVGLALNIAVLLFILFFIVIFGAVFAGAAGGL